MTAPTAAPGIDKGPWDVAKDGRTIYSDDFEHDAHLSIHGDFSSDEERKKYADWVADALTVASLRELLRSVDGAEK